MQHDSLSRASSASTARLLGPQYSQSSVSISPNNATAANLVQLSATSVPSSNQSLTMNFPVSKPLRNPPVSQQFTKDNRVDARGQVPSDSNSPWAVWQWQDIDAGSKWNDYPDRISKRV
jgi:hypothetical protein